MIDHSRFFKALDEQYDKLYESYYTFAAQPSIKTKNDLLLQLKKFGQIKNKFTNTIKNLYIGKIK